MGGIYAIEHIPTSKMYVGSAASFRSRKKQHFSDLRHGRHPNQHLQRAFNKYGEPEFRFIILEDSLGDLLELEKQWILKLQTVDQSKGYNFTCETKSPMKGRKHKASSRKKMSLKRQGSKHPMSKIDEDVVRSIFDLKKKGLNQGQIAHKVGIDQTNVSLILRGKAWQHVGMSIDESRFNNTSGCVGVYFAKKSNKWVAEIIHNKQYRHLGSYINKEDAVKARKEEEVNLGI